MWASQPGSIARGDPLVGPPCARPTRGERSERDDGGKLAIAKAVAHPDQGPEDEPEEPLEPDPPEDDPDPEEQLLARVLGVMDRFSAKLDELEDLRARNAELERLALDVAANKGTIAGESRMMLN
jgi:hypothetical protein